MCKVIAIANQKGGVGKTTTTLNLGIGLAESGKRVLLIDADPQGSLTISLRIKEPDGLDYTLASVLAAEINEEEYDLDQALLRIKGIDLLAANIELSAIETTLIMVMGREHMLKSMIEKVRNNYDYILIDCMPSLGMITVNALAAADSVLIPVQSAYLPVKGVQELMKTISLVKMRINHKLQIEGILLTMVENRTNVAKEIGLLVHDTYADHVRIFDAEIPSSVRVKETSSKGDSIYEHDPKGKVAFAYTALTKEVLANG